MRIERGAVSMPVAAMPSSPFEWKRRPAAGTQVGWGRGWRRGVAITLLRRGVAATPVLFGLNEFAYEN